MKRTLLLGILAFSMNSFSQSASSLDTSFGTGGKVFTDFNTYQETINSMAIQADGKIIVVGTGIVNTTNKNDFCVARYNIDGSLDVTFGTNGKVNYDITGFKANTNDNAKSVLIQSDGKIVICGNAPKNDATSSTSMVSAVIRLNTNGSLDTTFGTNGILKFYFDYNSCWANAMTLQSDGKLIIVGGKENNSSETDFAIARINTDGSFDTDFSNDGKSFVSLGNYDAALAVEVQNDQKILLIGSILGKVGFLKYTSSGNFDSSFGTNGILIADISNNISSISAVKVQPDGKILIVGTINYIPDIVLVRFNPDGTLDNTFGNLGITKVDIDNNSGDYVQCIDLQKDGKILVSGSCNTGGQYLFALLRFNTNGSLDTSFSGDGIQLTYVNESRANSVLIQSDEKILVAGGYSDFAIARYLGNSIFSSVNNIIDNNSVLVYPNPVKDILNIKLKNRQLQNSNIKITDLNGRLIYNGALSEDNKINIERVEKGMYFIFFENQNYTVKFIKD